ncbi:hypothetical protein GE107_16670 [Cohnella sp. CFH 77786]|uniref:hypothetical protein n=1 Tax=Cohnella sp. CFH 77786 TaxID=2662265 RepID=UPI001C60823B|nr:hypothetical protein [Cohnella sp. CFH 77786]MBW5447689.1 hypothetical protein [Cohnella sp. CFH 77786]
MDIRHTIEIIEKEITITLDEYNKWFVVDKNLMNFSPQYGWRIDQILEHVTLTNHFLLILIRKGKRTAIELSSKKNLGKELENYQFNLDKLHDISKHKSFAWIRPEHMEPKGEAGLSEIQT